ncbi:MAG: GvpL/GvpF family gas vesicle protein [Patescibacteria group bacterium]
MTEEGKYIYSIIKENKDRRFGSIGINNQEIHLLHYKDIAAVVSDASVVNFNRLNKKELIKYAAIHQKVQEVVMKDYDVAPMAFGIIAPSAYEVFHILEKAYLQFKTALKKIENKTEFVVHIFWDQKKLLEELVRTNLEIRRLKQEIVNKPSILKIPAKLKLGKLIHKALESQRKAYIKDTYSFLASFAFDSVFNKLIKDDMIANFSFLIRKTEESALDKKMQELGQRYEGKLKCKYIGPMPPYSFVNINLSLGNFELVDEARKLLGLREEATFGEIKNAYYKLAHQYHPDKYSDSPEKMKKMKKIIQAYSILENYCRSWNESIRQKRGFIERDVYQGQQKYSFKEADVKNSLFIR